MLIILFFISLVIIFSDCLAYQLTIGEELTYKVNWMHVRLGTVTIKVCDTLRMDDQKVYHARFFIDSNPLLFFVNMHNHYECYLDENFRPYLYESEETVDGSKCHTYYQFNYSDSLIQAKIIDQKDSTKTIEKSIPLDSYVLDGISLIFYIRNNLLVPKAEQLNIIAGGEKWLLDLKISDKKRRVRMTSIDRDFDAYEIEGKAHFTSTAGITGKFRAYFADDAQKPPLIAELKVFIGHVKLILESWKNWIPCPEEVAELQKEHSSHQDKSKF